MHRVDKVRMRSELREWEPLIEALTDGIFWIDIQE
jgi:hypothetical protein